MAHVDFVPPRRVVLYVQRRCPGCFTFIYGTFRDVRLQEPATVTSWWRSVAFNASTEIRGDPRSQHLYATALDITGRGAEDAAMQLQRAGWTVIDEVTHWHVQLFVSNPFPLQPPF